MARNFLLYWLPETAERHLNENYLLNHAGSNQLNRTAPGDVLWIVTTGEADELCLVGKLKVGRVLSLQEAKRILRRNDLWPSAWHALASVGSAGRMGGISLLEISGDLRFIDSGAARLSLQSGGGVSPAQLRVMRELDAASSRLLEELYTFAAAMRARI